MKIKDVHKATIVKYGEIEMINKAIQEFHELETVLNDHKYGKGSLSSIKEEIADCCNMIDKLCIMLGFTSLDINTIKHTKMLRTKKRLEND